MLTGHQPPGSLLDLTDLTDPTPSDAAGNFDNIPGYVRKLYIYTGSGLEVNCIQMVGEDYIMYTGRGRYSHIPSSQI